MEAQEDSTEGVSLEGAYNQNREERKVIGRERPVQVTGFGRNLFVKSVEKTAAIKLT